MSEESELLGALLVKRRLVTAAHLEEMLTQQPSSAKQLGQLLVESGRLDERDLALALSEQLGVPLADLRVEVPEPEALAMLSEVIARKNVAIPLRRTEDGLQIAVSDPFDEEVLLALKTAISETFTLLIAPPGDIRRMIEKSYRALSGVDRYVETFTATEAQRRVETIVRSAKSANDEAPIVQVVNLMITQALRDRASDIHIEPQEDRVRIRYRIDGALHDILSLPANMAPAIVSRVKIMAGMNIVERQRSQDGQIAMQLEGRDIDIRVATAATIWGEKTVLRLLDKSRSLYRFDDLGMPDQTHDEYSKLIRSPFGMVLCAGPTGSGKTTTLYASLNEINSAERNIMTIEDPVEYVFPSANQIQIKEQAGITFAGGLRAILRQDPDIILVGEIRDPETAGIAVQAALTGHLVLSSLHATDAPSALHRFLDMGIEAYLLASSILAVVGQRLVRRICQGCKVRYAPSAEELVFYTESGGAKKTKFWQGEGCNLCAHTGYQDRVGVYELFRVGEAAKQMLVRNASREELRGLAIEQGMRPLRAEALRLVYEDVTTIAEVLRAIYIV